MASLYDSAGFGIGLQAKPKDYIDVYLQRERQAGAKAKADEDDLDKIAQSINLRGTTPLHRILHPDAKQLATETIADIYQYKSTHPNTWKSYANNKALDFQLGLKRLESLSQNYRDLETTPDDQLTTPQREAKMKLQTGTSTKDLEGVGDVLGTVSLGQDKALSLSRKLSKVDIDKEVQDALGKENLMLQQNVQTKYGLPGNDYFVNTLKTQPSSPTEALKVQADLYKKFGVTLPVKDQETTLRELFKNRTDIQDSYLEKSRKELIQDGKLIIEPSQVDKYLENKFVRENLGKGGAKLSSSVQSYAKDKKDDSEGSAWVDDKTIGIGRKYVQTGFDEKTKKKTSKVVVDTEPITAKDFLRFGKSITRQISPEYVFDQATGEPVGVKGGKNYEFEGVGKFPYFIDKETGYARVLSDKAIKDPVFAGQVQYGWFGETLEKAGVREGRDITIPKMVPITTDIKKNLEKDEPLMKNIPDSELFGAKTQKKNAPAVGTEKGGYRFKGGDPNNKDNWEKL